MEEKLKRVLHTPEVLFIGINGVVGGGIFLLPGQIESLAGAKSLWAYLIAGAIAVLIGLTYAEASSMYTRTGGSYVYAEQAMGKTVGFTVGWMSWLTFIVGWGALTNGLVSYLTSLIPGMAPYQNLIIIGVIFLLCILNSLGVRTGSVMILLFSYVKLIPLALIILIGLGHFLHVDGGSMQMGTVSARNFGKAVLVLIFAYGGFEMATIPAGEMVNPRKSIAVGIIGTLLGVTLFYVLIQWTAVHLDPAIATSKAPLADAGKAMFAGGATLMTVGAMISILGTKSGIALSSPRILYALSFNRSLPGVFSKVWPRFQTPVVAIWTTGILVMILATTGTLTHLILLNVAARLYEYLMVCVAVIVLRFRAKEHHRAFRLPLSIFIPVIAGALCVWLLSQESEKQLLAAFIAMMIGLILYWVCRRVPRRAQ